MASKMLIDAAHPEETRVVVVRGNRVEEFDYESAAKKQLRGNIYLAKVTRVEPSLQAAFVDYGGNRHGFLAFSEIHPDYYQIPVADRKALLEEEAEEESRASAAEAAEDDAAARRRHRRGRRRRHSEGRAVEGAPLDPGPVAEDEEDEPAAASLALESADLVHGISEPAEGSSDEILADDHLSDNALRDPREEEDAREPRVAPMEANGEAVEEAIESVGSEDALEEVPERARRRRRVYKIQEVIKRRQIILVQVVKEERGTKGAALTTYLSLAGRYTVLMPNTARGGGISRKITNPADRKRLREIASELEVPEGMGLIIRTAGAQRTKTEIKRDYDYLLRLWENVRDLTLKSTAPALVYEEGNLIKRSIRDLYNKDIDEILVAGEDAYREAKDFMRMLMPSHAKNVKLYKEPEPIFIRYQVERQLAAMFSPQVVLKSGGYIVINQTEALVAIDVNSGKATREHSIEDTALKTNLEAAEEIARQLRLRDLAGLIVIDFIDMDERRNSRAVERRLKECLRNDRARLQVGRISHFGLLEMSRQRLRTGMLEGSTSPCPMCQGTGIVRSIESVALDVLRSLEDRLLTEGPMPLTATTSVEVALYILNQKRAHVKDIEMRYRSRITVTADEELHVSQFTIERTAPSELIEEEPAVVQMDWAHHEPLPVAPQAEPEQAPQRRGRRRRRRRRGAGEQEAAQREPVFAQAPLLAEEKAVESGRQEPQAYPSSEGQTQPRKQRRRGRRGGRRGRGRGAERRGAVLDATSSQASEAEDQSRPGNGATAAADREESPELTAEQSAPRGEAPPGPVGEPASQTLTRSETEADGAPPRRGWWQRQA